MKMPTPKNVDEQLGQLEGRKPYVYKDSRQLWTIGDGILVDKDAGGGLLPEEMDFIKANRIRLTTEGVLKALPWVKDLSAPRQAVVIGMAYQMGLGVRGKSGLLSFSNTLEYMRTSSHEAAQKGMLASDWAKQTPNRAKLLARQWLTNTWQAVDW